jgi:hypothetical protein
MAKKLNKLVARVAALERTVAEFLGVKKPGKTAKKAKKAKAAAKKPDTKKSKAKKSAAKSRKPAAAPKARPKSKSRKKQRVPIPGIEQLAISGEPQFVTPLDKV